jgi:spore germination protein
MNRPRPVALAVLVALLAACAPAAPSPSSAARSPIAGRPSLVVPSGGGSVPSPATPAPTPPGPSPTATPSARPSPTATPSATPTAPATAWDPDRFGFAAKGLSNEVLAFMAMDQTDYVLDTMDWDAVSTLAFFSLEATADGTIARDAGWNRWTSTKFGRVIRTAHEHGTKVVMSLERFSWSAGQTAVTRRLLASAERRGRLAREVAEEVARRGVDGVNVDFEPIPSGQKDEFTDFMRRLRRELDRIAPESQLTFCVVGHHESYDVDAATGPDAADAVYLMGYHYAGTWSKRAGSTAPMGGPQHDVVDSVKSLLREVERHELIVGLPYYGHAWPTAGARLNAATQDGGFDVTLDRALRIAEQHDVRYDKVQQVAWIPYKARPCDGCAVRWYQLYFDDARALEYKLTWIKRNKLLGTGIWTIGYEGRLGGHAEAMRRVLLGE